mmetsp:Transcript_9185/g.13886  ORF Transcript_9185/g.13886 Transcript_9185/m.13886 type:complete len:482 (-) Transcript_9185:90-1535(-)
MISLTHSIRSQLTLLSKRSFGCCAGLVDDKQQTTPLTENEQEKAEYGFEVFSTNWKFGPGVASELLTDLKKRDVRRVGIFTDPTVRQLEFFSRVVEPILTNGSIEVEIFDKVLIEPSLDSFLEGAEFCRDGQFDLHVSIGGGSVMDTTKAASLYAAVKPQDNDPFAFINAPIGRASFPPAQELNRLVKPHIAVPTTSGTGSESTCLSICKIPSMDNCKTGIAHPVLYPTLAVIDPTACYSLPNTVVAASGFDVLSHAIESYTARHFTTRRPVRTPAGTRPVLQGSNPFADIGCQHALRLCGKYFLRAVADPDDKEARDWMMFASTIAGTSMGNAGTQLPHGLSYPVSGAVRSFQAKNYPTEHGPIIPHGMAVVLHAPSVARYINKYVSKKHVDVLHLLDDTHHSSTHIKQEEAGELLAQKLIGYMQATHMPNGLNAVGYDLDDLDMLVKAAFPQKRVIDNAPFKVEKDHLYDLYKGAMSYW